MKSRRNYALVAWLIWLCGAGLWIAPAAADEGDSPAGAAGKVDPQHAAKMKRGLALFREKVRPVLEMHCLDCHGGRSTKADFDLSTRERLLESGMLGEDAANSYLFDLITHAEEPHMPFKAPRLGDATIKHIGEWIDLGAPYDKPLKKAGALSASAAMQVTDEDRRFWSFQPLKQVTPPEVRDAAWCRTSIDRFILAAQKRVGLHPNSPAERRLLIRRAYYDLLGLPPSPGEVEAFVADDDPQAYGRLVDRLLDSTHYGERWARYWIDVARFAESHGYEQDYDRPHAYHYRDFLIRAFNADMPYDQFVKWQLAGDELAPDDPLALMATGFLGGGAFPTQLTEAEFESARYDELDDITATTGVAFLGLSVGCARCHDHKFDPIPTRDYYRLAATFTKTIRSEIDLAVQPGAEPVKVQVTSEGFPHMTHHADGRGFPHFYEKTHFLTRGDVHQKGDVAAPGFLQVLMRSDKGPAHWQTEPPKDWTRTSYRRTGLAEWITDPDHGAGHLAARVMVNRVWQHHFGKGLVATPNDFGLQGELPTHPELLDWLAGDLIAHGWKLKRLHKLIMTSSVYLQSSAFDEERAALDRENHLHWRRTPRRLDAEAIRDAMLAVAGLLDETMYGPGTLDTAMRRRSVYFFIKRSQPITTMLLFDWPEHLVSIGARATTTTAPQALLFMNSPLSRECAEALAGRLGEGTVEEQVDRVYALALSRPPQAREVQAAQEFLPRQTSTYAAEGRDDAARAALVDYCQAVLSSNEFVYVD